MKRIAKNNKKRRNNQELQVKNLSSPKRKHIETTENSLSNRKFKEIIKKNSADWKVSSISDHYFTKNGNLFFSVRFVIELIFIQSVYTLLYYPITFIFNY